MRYYIGQYLNESHFACFYTSTSEELANFLASFIDKSLQPDCTVLSYDDALKNNIAVIGD